MLKNNYLLLLLIVGVACIVSGSDNTGNPPVISPPNEAAIPTQDQLIQELEEFRKLSQRLQEQISLRQAQIQKQIGQANPTTFNLNATAEKIDDNPQSGPQKNESVSNNTTSVVTPPASASKETPSAPSKETTKSDVTASAPSPPAPASKETTSAPSKETTKSNVMASAPSPPATTSNGTKSAPTTVPTPTTTPGGAGTAQCSYIVMIASTLYASIYMLSI